MSVLNDIGRWLWRLLPGNPILLRVVSAAGKRPKHQWARVIYVTALFVVVLVMGTNSLSARGNSLADLAKQATNVFMAVSLVQLFLMAFIAPVFTAGAITQEKDANTFHILLTTPLSTGQIVLGTLFSRLFFVWALLLAGVPIFCITMIYGGVTTREVFESLGLAACTGLVTGALAILISVLRVGTRRTIFSFFVGVAVYLLAIWALAFTDWGQLPRSIAPESVSTMSLVGSRMSWLAPVHPFLALFVVTGQTQAPPLSNVVAYGWPWNWLLAYPHYGYMLLTILASIVMIVLSLFFVRAGEKEGEPTWLNRLSALIARKDTLGERRHAPRRVWSNPIAWREAKTRASASGRSVMRWVFVGAGAIAGVVLLMAHEQSWWILSVKDPATARTVLTTLIWIELAVILLIVTNAAATSLTREKESLTMELLLSTPLTSRYIVAGMLRGLVSFATPMILVPTFTIVLFVIADLRRPAGTHVITPEAVLLAPLLITAFCALAAMSGLGVSLRSRRTVQSVMISTVVVMGAAGLLWVCGIAITSGGGLLSSVLLPLTPFPALQAIVDYPHLFAGARSAPSPSDLFVARIARSIASLVAVAVYAGITFAVYNNMVRNFDMTVRRQSA